MAEINFLMSSLQRLYKLQGHSRRHITPFVTYFKYDLSYFNWELLKVGQWDRVLMMYVDGSSPIRHVATRKVTLISEASLGRREKWLFGTRKDVSLRRGASMITIMTTWPQGPRLISPS